MNNIEGKRITFKRARPNPLFNDWLEELYVEAQQKKSKYKSTLKEALTSISKYPLPLQTGSECAILKGFDKRLCLFLDKRLEEYKNCQSKDYVKSFKPDENTRITSSNLCQNNEIESLPNDKQVLRKNKNKYKPVFRSGGYAILMALLDHTTHSNKKSLQKDELIDLAQKYREESFTRPKPETFYTAWSNMARLIAKGLVQKSGKKCQYSLTESGVSVAKELLLDTQKIPSVNDKIFNDLQNNVDKVHENCSPVNNDKIINNIMPKSKYVEDIGIVTILNHELIIMEAGSFDVILLIDKNETSGLSKKNDPTMAEFNKYPDLKHEYRSLKIGDFAWIARHKESNEELVLPYVVERKRMDDLAASIKDGRFHEQKFRLRKCGLHHVFYMVENYGSNKHVGLPIHTLMQALANTRTQDGFKVHVTNSLNHSARFLAMMTLRLTFEFKDKMLKGHNKEAKEDVFMTFEYFNKSSLKNKPLSVTDTFIKLLLQLKGVSVEKALAITNVYKTPMSLIKEYKICSPRDGELLLANLKCGEMSRSVGPSVSKTVYQLLTLLDFS